MITPERVRELLKNVPIGHGWVVADSYPNWVILWGPDEHPHSIASVEDRNSARLIAAAPDLAKAYLDAMDRIARLEGQLAYALDTVGEAAAASLGDAS